MSPAGSLESFLSAIEAGADSIYLGLKKFNARVPAKNFTINQLKKITTYAHSKNVKIYITLNIDLKSNELFEASQIVSLVDKLNIDALIVRDFSLLLIIKNFFPSIEVHLSTQTAVDSSYGVSFLRNYPVKRVVLARELELTEIEKCSKLDNIETEIFVEGSMCFSVSGRCLISSFVGGKSGNRGSCTAPCRVEWQLNSDKKSFFSMRDLMLIDELEKVKSVGVKALKIEGRLKNYEWVKTITSIYREALNNEKFDINKLKLKLSNYSAREKTNGHIYSHTNLIGDNKEWSNYKKEKTSLPVDIELFNEKKLIDIAINDDKIKIGIIIDSINKTKEYDRISEPPKKGKPYSLNCIIDKIKEDLFFDEFEVTLDSGSDILTSGVFLNSLLADIKKEIRNIIDETETLPELNEKIISFITPKQVFKTKEKLLGSKPDKIIILSSDIDKFFDKTKIKEITTIQIYINSNIDIKKLKNLSNNYEIVISLPTMIYESNVQNIKNQINNILNSGFTNFQANSLTGVEILKSIDCNRSVGYGLPVLNHLAANFFYENGYKSVTASLEADSSILKSLSNFVENSIEIVVFSKVELFTSRVESEYFKNRNLFKDKYIEMECFKQNENSVFVSKMPFSLMGDKIKLEKIYFDSLIADLRYFDSPYDIITKILSDNYRGETTTFNFYRKLQ